MSAIRGYFEVLFPRKYSLNWFIPALVNIRVGSSLITMGAEGTMRWSLPLKKARKFSRISLEVIEKAKVLVILTQTAKQFLYLFVLILRKDKNRIIYIHV